MSSISDRNPTLQGGYSEVSIQSETTGKGKFDHREFRSRRNAARTGRGQRGAYPNATNDNTLCVLRGEHLIARRNMRNFHANRGEPSLAVFSSLNGMPWSRWPSVDAMARSFLFVGRAKNDYLLPNQPNSQYQTETGLGWVESGKASTKHTGTKVIQAGDLVELVFPPVSLEQSQLTPSGATFKSKSTLRGGEHMGKYMMMTEPVDPVNFGRQIMGAHALCVRSRNMNPCPGISDVDFVEMYHGILGNRSQRYFTDGQNCAAGMCYGLLSAVCSGADTLQTDILNWAQAFNDPNNTENRPVGLYLADTMGVFAKNGVGRNRMRDVLDDIFLNNVSGYSARKAAVQRLKAQYSGAFKQGTSGMQLADGSSDEIQYAMLRLDGLTLLMGGMGSATFEKNRWIIGKV